MSEALRLAKNYAEHCVLSGGLVFGGDNYAKLEKELRRLAAVEQELAALKRAISDAEPVAWSTGIKWHPVAHYQSEKVQKLTRKSQPEHGFTEPLYTLKGIK